MNDEKLLERIKFDKNILAGKPIIRGLRIPVAMILELLAKGSTNQEILEDYPELELEDIQAALFYAYYLVSQEEVLDRVIAMKNKFRIRQANFE
ncbi:DUF433 domain-containing protein [Nostoc sp. NMS4]|uniref:DUF433 domain-containing protein n=1 Tax=Nostoc sp. NMS4 TaxID=2815390 RepID=UPI0025DDD320|nr:DUF433 domain-containing protein [Nostoc sp. NMS4]MBN3927411.1 DUF433 domain-containing protein [Nostoc sp. NMS4]